MDDLALVSLDAIWEELKNRYDGVILCTVKSRDNKNEERQLSFSGGKFICIGLAEYTKYKLIKECERDINA